MYKIKLIFYTFYLTFKSRQTNLVLMSNIGGAKLYFKNRKILVSKRLINHGFEFISYFRMSVRALLNK
jgi:hypothetical protein